MNTIFVFIATTAEHLVLSPIVTTAILTVAAWAVCVLRGPAGVTAKRSSDIIDNSLANCDWAGW